MKRVIAPLTALVLVLLAAPAAFAAKPPAPPGQEKAKKEKLGEVTLLAFNDFHGHMEANTPGTIAVGCCTPDPRTGLPVPITVAAGGGEYFSTHLKALGSANRNTYVVSAGDMIGASPLLSGLFHDEPTIEAMNAMGVDVNGVGNHEFDEGKAELLRMQSGPLAPGARPDGCHPIDGCQDGTPFYGSVFQFLAANVIDTSTNNPLLPPYEIVNTSFGTKIAFIGETLEGTPLIVTPTGVAGLEFLDEADTVNRLVPILKQRQVEAIVLLLHQGGTQRAPFSEGFMNVDRCENFSGADVIDIVERLDPAVDVVVSGHTHQPYICNIDGRLVTGASSFGRVITELDLTIDRRTRDVVAATADNHVVTQTVAKDPAITTIIEHYKQFSDPIANEVVGSITADIRSSRDPGGFTSPSGEQEMGEVIADAQLAATSPSDFGSSVAAFMNPGGVRAHLLHDQISGGEEPGEVTYGEMFTVQPFGNSLVVKTCTGAQLDALLEQQWFVRSDGTVGQTVLQVSEGFTYTWSASAPIGSRVDPASIKIDGVMVNPATGYRVTMNSFLADGGDGFSVFRQCTNPLGGEVDLDAAVRYFMENSPISPPPLTRIKRVS